MCVSVSPSASSTVADISRGRDARKAINAKREAGLEEESNRSRTESDAACRRHASNVNIGAGGIQGAEGDCATVHMLRQSGTSVAGCGVFCEHCDILGASVRIEAHGRERDL